MRSAFLAAAFAVSSTVLAAAPARANGRYPASNAIVFSPTDPNLMVLRATYGIMPSHDYGQSWTWLCEDALGLPPTTNEDPTIGLTSNESMVVAISLGLEVSANTGCSWVFDPGLEGQNVKDLVVRPDAPHTVLAVSSTLEQDAGLPADAGYRYAQQVYISTDDGAHWAPLGSPIDPTAIVTTIEVAKTDPARIYLSAFRNVTPRTASLFVSTNSGTTWTEYPSPLDPSTETATYIAAVDPQNADVVYVRTEGASRLLVSTDGGHTFQVKYSLDDQMLGFALSEDGTKVYLGGPNTGLFMAPSSTLAFQQVSKIDVQCLAVHGTDLWACSDEKSGFVAGVSQNDGTSFTPKLHLNGISGPIACEADATASQCSGALYDAMCANLGGCLAASSAEAGPLDAAVTGGEAQEPTPSRASCGCSVVGGGGAAGAVAAVLSALVAARRRRGR